MKIDVVNNPEFQKALNHCIQQSIEACESCGATYSEAYLENKWQRRLYDAYGKDCKTADQLIAYAEKEFCF